MGLTPLTDALIYKGGKSQKQRNWLTFRVVGELKEYRANRRSTVSSVVELTEKHPFTRAGIYLCLEQRLGSALYAEWKAAIKSGGRSDEDLLEELTQTMSQENIDFWHCRIDRVTCQRRLQRMLKVEDSRTLRLLDQVPETVRTQHALLRRIQCHGGQIRFRSITMTVHFDMAIYRVDPTYQITRNYEFLEEHGIYPADLQMYLVYGLTLAQKQERTRILREQHGNSMRNLKVSVPANTT